MVTLLNQSFNFLLPKNDEIEGWILNDQESLLHFIAGYADAEGSYFVRKPNYKYAKSGWGIFEIASYDKNILSMTSQELSSIGIDHAFYQVKNRIYKKEMWRITINKKQALWNFIKIIEPYHRHQKRLRNLTEVKENLILRNSLPYCRQITL